MLSGGDFELCMDILVVTYVTSVCNRCLFGFHVQRNVQRPNLIREAIDHAEAQPVIPRLKLKFLVCGDPGLQQRLVSVWRQIPRKVRSPHRRMQRRLVQSPSGYVLPFARKNTPTEAGAK